jgi:hypothetical protein
MATVNRFEELEIWQLAFAETQDFDILVKSTDLPKDFGLKNQMRKGSKDQVIMNSKIFLSLPKVQMANSGHNFIDA